MNMNNLILNTDSYKPSQWAQYVKGLETTFSYVESRGGKFKTTTMFGLQMFLKEYLSKPITLADIDEADEFLSAHGVPFYREGWEYILNEYEGYMPVRIRSVAEGVTVPTGNILLSIENTDPKCGWLTSYLETALLRAIWYPTTVATNSREAKKVIYNYLENTGDTAGIDFKLHDFGARGVSSFESAGIGGAAHLVNFMGSDTITGIRYANEYYNAGMAGFSIPATEHSTMTSWGKDNESDAYRNMLNLYAKPDAILAIVSDSYDLFNAVENIFGIELKQQIIDSGAMVVIRPDSGDPASIVLRTLQLLDKQFGSTLNDKGYKVLNNVRVIQGDGINLESIGDILAMATSAKFSADNIAFGMGGGLLQQLDRDTQKFAMKASAMRVNGKWRDIYKDPKTDPGKRSKRGRMTLVQDDYLNMRTVRLNEVGDQVNLMKTRFLNGKLMNEINFKEVRKNAVI